jgi:E3 ubiquitin-protein ligase MARCH6
MLLITVSVLQLREVLHPNLLASLIRPQEPQPDLIGNLLTDPGLTHAKRMLLSLLIYVVLLHVHVHLPAVLLAALSSSPKQTFTPRVHYFVPLLQVPIELFFFHLSMLAVLEK